jgi:hypothetical protein
VKGVLPHIWGTDELNQKSPDGVFASESHFKLRGNSSTIPISPNVRESSKNLPFCPV